MSRQVTRKHMYFYKFLECFESGECPLCRCVTGRVDRFFRTLLYENVNDGGFRRRFRASGGFCNHHAYQLMDCGDGLAAAILYQSVLEQETERLDRIGASGRSPRHEACPACVVASEAESDHLSTFGRFVEDEELRDGYQRSAGYCLPHYRLIAEGLESVPGWLSSGQERRLQELEVSLTAFLEYSNFTNPERRDLSREEQLVWKRAIATASGYRGMREGPRRLPARSARTNRG